MKSTTVDASALPEALREQFHRNLRAVELVLAGVSQTSVAKESGIARSTLSRLVQRTRQMGQVACIPHGSYTRAAALHPAFQECIRLDLQQFLDSGVSLVECPDCTSTSALSPHKGVLRFKSHNKRKTPSRSTEPRWVKRGMNWEVVGK